MKVCSRVFVSHAAASPESWQAVNSFAAALKDKGFDVFEYRHDIQSGQQWRYWLLAALLLCDAAIILQDRRATRRKWVRYETEVLKARKEFEPGFVLDTVSVEPGANMDALLDGLDIRPGIDMARETSKYVTLVERAIQECSQSLDDAACKTCIDALVVERKIASHFRLVPAHVRKEILDKLERTPAWQGSDIAWGVLDALRCVTPMSGAEDERVIYELGRAIVRRGLHAVRILRDYRPYISPQGADAIVDWLVPLMVPLAAVLPLANLVTRESLGPGPYVTNVSADVIVYAIRRAWGAERGPSHNLPIFRFPGEGGIGGIHERVNEIRAGLRDYLRLPSDTPDHAVDRLTRKVVPPLVTEDQNAALMFVVVDPYMTTDERDELRHEIPNAAFIFAGCASDLPDPPGATRLADFDGDEIQRLVRYTRVGFQRSGSLRPHWRARENSNRPADSA